MLARIGTLARGFLGRLVARAERRNPEALLEVEKNNLRRQIADYNQGLAAHAGLCERLMTQARRLEAEERELPARTAAHLRAGQREAAGQLALRLRSVSHDLHEYRRQIQQAEATYQELLEARNVTVKAAQARLDALRLRLDDLKLQRASAELHEMAAGLVTSIGGSGDTLARLHEMIEQEREQASGRARVARDSLWRRESRLRDDEAQALGEEALLEFAAREGLSLDAPASASVPALPAKSAPRAAD